jgi:hypothetical protein
MVNILVAAALCFCVQRWSALCTQVVHAAESAQSRDSAPGKRAPRNRGESFANILITYSLFEMFFPSSAQPARLVVRRLLPLRMILAD